MAVLTPHDTIVVRLPYPVKIMGLIVHIRRKIGFSFTNLASLLFYEEYKTGTSKKFSEWVEKHGQAAAFNELTYFAAVAYCQLHPPLIFFRRKRQNFTKEGLLKALALADEKTQKAIIDCWQLSQTYGTTSKKKQKAKVTRL